MELIDILRQKILPPVPMEIAKYSSSIESDKLLIKPVIEINKAHIIMLAKQDILNKKEATSILKTLSEIPPDMMLDPLFEDVHMQIESYLIGKLGEEVGGRLHVAKSRNDQVATAIRMTLRTYLFEIVQALIEFRTTLLIRCDEYLEAVMPGYTHLQHAQPITIAHHLLAHHDALERDTKRVMDAFSFVNLSPMGACALATTSFNINRELVAELLGFDGLIENSVDAVSSRDFVVDVLADYALIMTNLSRMGEETILWNTSEFSTVILPDTYVSTSSIMPQKRNPVVAELLRAKTAHVYGDLIATLTILKALPLSYNLDLQEITPHLWNSHTVTLTSIKMATGIFKNLKFDIQRWIELVTDDFSTATELTDMLVREYDLPFRTAYTIVGKIVQKVASEGKKMKAITPEMLSTTILGTIDKKIQIDPSKFYAALNPVENVNTKSVIGGPSSIEVLRMKNKRAKKIVTDEAWYNTHISKLKKANSKLCSMIKMLEGGEKTES
ncbi:argininosuccinate lyase [Candidatus Bathyarchaeota archaeon]|nr:argininosuccinate lyase [Candidatus Bathyarchaeota archaeon]